jgi:N-acetylglucosaminyldiphosphoundecaprenol N-acetyl-beta-D-mannosaminyltransferase
VESGVTEEAALPEVAIREAGVTVHNISSDKAVELIIKWARDGSGGYVSTPNLDHLVRAKRDPSFRRLMMGARLRVPDGQWLIYGSRLGGTPIHEAVHGRLLPEEIIRRTAPDTPPFALIGGRDNAPQVAADKLRAMGATVVAAVSPPMGFEIGGAEDSKAVAELIEARPRIVIVGLGAPKQEQWMARHQSDLPNTVMLGLGQTIDILGDRIPAAPRWMTRFGFEWAFRMLRDPKRIGRRVFIDDPPFFWWMLRARLSRH